MVSRSCSLVVAGEEKRRTVVAREMEENGRGCYLYG
jgi:hypothetical protein